MPVPIKKGSSFTNCGLKLFFKHLKESKTNDWRMKWELVKVTLKKT
jgi:hypothetical protein